MGTRENKYWEVAATPGCSGQSPANTGNFGTSNMGWEVGMGQICQICQICQI